RARDWGLVDHLARPAVFAQAVRERALALAATSDRPESARRVSLPPLRREDHAGGLAYDHVDVTIDRTKRMATITVRAPSSPVPQDIGAIVAQGAAWWPLAMARALDDAILTLRTNEASL